MKEALKIFAITALTVIIATIGSTLFVLLSGMEVRDLFTTVAIVDILALLIVSGIAFIFWE